MKWFKHESTFNNPKIKLLKRKHKALGYAVYFQILELIGEALDKKSHEEWFYLPSEYSNDLEFLADEVGVELEELTPILETCYAVNLLQNENGRIKCAQLQERADEYTEKILKKNDKKEKVSGQTPDNIGTISGIRREKEKKKIRKEEKIGASVTYLSSIPIEDVQQFTTAYTCSTSQVTLKAEQLVNYCKKTGRSYKDYRAALQDWLLKDYGKRKPAQQFKPQEAAPEQTPEEQAAVRRRIEEDKKRFSVKGFPKGGIT